MHYTPRGMTAPSLGRYPTPVKRLDGLSTERAELWLKDDGRAHPEYGGNKVRKLEPLLEEAARRGVRRLVAVGAAGSHQVVATALFGRRRGFGVTAVLCPQPWTPHAERALSASLALGVEPVPVPSMAEVPWALARLRRPGDHVLLPGGAGALGTIGYVRAAFELAEQVALGELPEPDVIVVPVASGGTAGGLAAGAVAAGLRCGVLGVCVGVAGPLLTGALAIAQGEVAARREHATGTFRKRRARLVLDDAFRGRGYAWPTAEGARAADVARAYGVDLDPTYTAKAFAGALELVRSAAGGTKNPGLPTSRTGEPLRVLYWHTLSARDAAELGMVTKLPPDLARLLVRD